MKLINDMIDNLPGGFFIYRADESKEIISFNKEVMKIYGCSSEEEFEELTRNSFKGMVHPEDYNLVERRIDLQVTDQNDLDYVEYRIISRDDEVKYVRDYGRLVHSHTDGDVYYVFIHDVTQNRMMNERMIREEALVSGALCKEYTSIFKIDVESKKVSLYRSDGKGMSPNFLTALFSNNDYEEVLSKYIDTFVVYEDQRRLRSLAKLESLLQNVPMDGYYKLGYRRYVNGITSFYEMNFARIENETGSITFILGLRNVDEEMRRQLKQTKEMEIQREIIEGLGSEYYSVLLVDPITDYVTSFRAIDEEGKAIKRYFLKYNNCWTKGVECYSKELITENSYHEFVEKLSLDYIKAHHTDYSFIYEKIVDDGIIYLQTKVTYVHDETGKLAIVIGTKNVDEIIKKEKQRERTLQIALNEAKAANVAKTDFLSKMSHDIRTPLNGILGLLEMDERHPDDKELIEENRGKIKVAASHLNSLINDILQLSKLEIGNIELSRDVFELSDLYEDVVAMAGMDAVEHGITFNHKEIHVNTDNTFVYGSPLHLRQVLLNIINNAIKYNKPNGSITCETQYEQVDETHIVCCYTIADTGIGMSKEFMEHIFEPFSQERNDARSTYLGTGLGMAIVKSLVDKMEGIIEIDSRLGEGSTFYITIPFEIASAVLVKKTEGEEENISIKDLRILIVEDNELNMEIAQYLLEDAGAVVTKAYDGQQAVDIFESHPTGYFDAILMDIMMPRMNGIEATKNIRLMNRSDAQMIPIIAMTANAFEEDKQATKKAGMNAHLSKPLKGKDVLHAIAKYSHRL